MEQITEDTDKQTEWTKHKKYKSRQNTNTKRITGSNSNNNSKTRPCTKIVSFSINDISSYGYSIQLTTKMIKLMKNLMKKFLKPKETRAMATTTPTLNI